MVAEYDIHRKSYKYGVKDWQLLVTILRDYSGELVKLSKEFSEKNSYYKFQRVMSPFIELLLTILIIYVFLIGGVLISVNLNSNKLLQALTLAAMFVPIILLLIVILLNTMSEVRHKRLVLKQTEKDARVLASRLESALRLTISVADQVEISLAKKLEMDLYIDKSSSALENYYLILDTKSKYKNSKNREIFEPLSNALSKLESQNKKTRLSGIYDLEQVGIDMPSDYHMAVVESLSAFLKDRQSVDNISKIFTIYKRRYDVMFNALRRWILVTHNLFTLQGYMPKYKKNQTVFYPEIPDDIYAALNVLGRRNTSEEPEIFGIDLRRVDLTGIEIRAFDFTNANLRDCSFAYADLQGIDFSCADLRGTNFSHAKIRDSIFEKADLHGANFTNADLNIVNFRYANLNATNFTEATLDEVIADVKNSERGVFYGCHNVKFSWNENNINSST